MVGCDDEKSCDFYNKFRRTVWMVNISSGGQYEGTVIMVFYQGSLRVMIVAAVRTEA